MDKVTIDEIVEGFCDDKTSEEVVTIMYRIFEQLGIDHPKGLKIVV